MLQHRSSGNSWVLRRCSHLVAHPECKGAVSRCRCQATVIGRKARRTWLYSTQTLICRPNRACATRSSRCPPQTLPDATASPILRPRGALRVLEADVSLVSRECILPSRVEHLGSDLCRQLHEVLSHGCVLLAPGILRLTEHSNVPRGAAIDERSSSIRPAAVEWCIN